MTEWIEKKISELGTVVGGATPSTKDEQNYIDGSIPWITPKDLAGFRGRYISRGERSITQKGLASCSAQMMPKHSVLFTSRAPIGYVAISANPVCTNQGFKSVVPNENTDYLFLYYLLKFYKDKIEALGSGTTFKEVSGTTMKNIVVRVPKEKEKQREIGLILSSIDDKIEANEKINHNLQQQFQALFDSWFKRFEPFSQPKYESELGLIPEGWSVKDIYSISSIIYGAPFSSKLFNDEHKGSPIVRIRDLKTQNTSTYTTEIHPKGYLIQNGDIIVGMDGEFRPYIWGSGEAWLNQRVCVFENKRPKGKVFLFCSIKPLLNLIEQTEVATTVIHIGKQDFDAFRIVMPPIEILNAFDDITAPMYNRIVNNIMENHRLSALRDSLLPRLMSGEINVSEVEL